MVFKYIVIQYGIILFNEHTTHSQVAKGFEKVYSAGFCEIEFNKFGEAEVKSYGASESLKLESIPEKDNVLIADFFNPVSKTKYFGFDVEGFYTGSEKSETKPVVIWQSEQVCPKCKSDDIKERSGYKVCFKCGHHF